MSLSRKTVGDLVAEARKRVPELSNEELAEAMRSGTLVVDIRDVRERWRDGAIPGAVHAPRGMLEFWADQTSEYHKDFFDPDRPIALYCNKGDRSALGAVALAELGYSHVSHLAGGFSGWQEAGCETEKVEPRQR
jgi:rhodanese-related sulfurtransferase